MRTVEDLVGVVLGLGLLLSPFLAVGAVAALVTDRRNKRKMAEGLPIGASPLASFVLGALVAFGLAAVVAGAACVVIVSSFA